MLHQIENTTAQPSPAQHNRHAILNVFKCFYLIVLSIRLEEFVAEHFNLIELFALRCIYIYFAVRLQNPSRVVETFSGRIKCAEAIY